MIYPLVFIPVKNTIISGDSSLPFQCIRIVFKSFCNMFPLTQQMLRSLNPFSANLFFVSALCRYLFIFLFTANIKTKADTNPFRNSSSKHPRITQWIQNENAFTVCPHLRNAGPSRHLSGKVKSTLANTQSLSLCTHTHIHTIHALEEIERTLLVTLKNKNKM